MKIKIGDLCFYDAGECYRPPYEDESLVICTCYTNQGGDSPLTELIFGKNLFGIPNGKILTSNGLYVRPKHLIKLINIFNYTDEELYWFQNEMFRRGIDLGECLDNMEL